MTRQASTSSSTPAPAACTARRCRSRPRAEAGRAGARHDVRPGRAPASSPGPGARRGRPRRPGHAGRAGGRGVRAVARRRARHRAGAGRTARRGSPRREVAARALARRFGSLLVLVCAVALQLFFVARIALMAMVDPQSTTFQRSEAWRIATEKGPAPGASNGSTTGDLGAPEARGDRLGGRRLRQSQRRRLGRDREGLGAQRARRGGRRASGRASATARARPARRRRDEPPARAAKVVGGSTITQQLAKNLLLTGERTLLRKGQELVLTLRARSDARQAAHPRDLPEQRRMGRRRVRRRGGGAALLPHRRRRARRRRRRRGSR